MPGIRSGNDSIDAQVADCIGLVSNKPKWRCKNSANPQIRTLCAGHAATELLGSAPCSELATIVRPRWIAYPP